MKTKGEPTMGYFNKDEYELVETRIGMLLSLYEDARIVTENMSTPADRERGIWVVKAHIYLNQDDQRFRLPKSTGYAFEVDGGTGANKTSALENCETSAIGRALANMGLHGNKRASREEMEKVERGITPKPDAWEKPLINWAEEIANLEHADGARGLYALAKAENAPKAVLEAITARGKELVDEPIDNEKD
jgi:hypothetical protein